MDTHPGGLYRVGDKIVDAEGREVENGAELVAEREARAQEEAIKASANEGASAVQDLATKLAMAMAGGKVVAPKPTVKVE